MTRKEQYLSNILRQLEDFLKTDWPLNSWIENKGLRVYVRQSTRHLFYPDSEENITCLDIASICITQRYRRQGFFTDFVMKAHEIHPFDTTYIEAIQNPLVLEWCVKRSWRPHSHHPKYPANCFYLPKSPKCIDLVEREKDHNPFPVSQ